MRKFLLLCLLGLGMLLPTNTITAKESVAKRNLAKRTVSIVIESNVLSANSQPADGPINSMVIKTVPGGVTVASQDCGGSYSCSMDISQLPAGYYVVQVYCQYRLYEKQFKKG